MKVTWDPAKRTATLRDRKIDFAEARRVFAGTTVDIVDDRRDYGEVRIVSVGTFDGRMVVIVWTQRGEARHVISMRKANEREKARYRNRLG